jgi:hypothetical protein
LKALQKGGTTARIAYMEEADPGSFVGISVNLEDPFIDRHWVWGKFTREEVLERLADAEMLDKKEFYLQYFRAFFLPRTDDPEAPWEALVKLAGWDPTTHRPRIKVGEQKPSTKRNKSRLDYAMERNRGTYKPRTTTSYSAPRGRATKVPLSSVKLYRLKEDDSLWISPVNYAKVIGLPPQYIYQAISKGKFKTKQGPKSKLIRLSDADKYYGRKDGVLEQDSAGDAGPEVVERGAGIARGPEDSRSVPESTSSRREGDATGEGTQGNRDHPTVPGPRASAPRNWVIVKHNADGSESFREPTGWVQDEVQAYRLSEQEARNLVSDLAMQFGYRGLEAREVK